MNINLGEKRYIISDAAKIIDVESHVLRYWEEELEIEIPRNELGHRYYTDYYVELFKKIKDLKESGFQLKAIRMLLPELMEINSDRQSENREDKLEDSRESGDVNQKELKSNSSEVLKQELLQRVSEPARENTEIGINSKESKLEQFQRILSDVVANALKENNRLLGQEVGDKVSDNLIKEMDYLMQMREQKDEERYKKLDETIRNYQALNREKNQKSRGFVEKIKTRLL